MTVPEAHIAVDPGLQFCSIVQEAREVTHDANLVCLLKMYLHLTHWLSGNYREREEGLPSTVEKGGILKLIYEQS